MQWFKKKKIENIKDILIKKANILLEILKDILINQAIIMLGLNFKLVLQTQGIYHYHQNNIKEMILLLKLLMIMEFQTYRT